MQNKFETYFKEHFNIFHMWVDCFVPTNMSDWVLGHWYFFHTKEVGIAELNSKAENLQTLMATRSYLKSSFKTMYEFSLIWGNKYNIKIGRTTERYTFRN